MVIFNSVKEIQEAVAAYKTSSKTIGFVPTMGALHEGHLSLIKRCKSENDICIVSIFVNPTQFNNKQDLATYPRDLGKDAKLLESVDCDIIFAPTEQEIYNDNELAGTFSFSFNGLDEVMEGKFRPGHFNGVVQIVSKLFSIVTPSKAYFGEKDFQQVAIIKHMVKELKYPVEIIPCPILREGSGLALSSRNTLLTSEEKKKAITISKVLNECRNFVARMSPEELTQWVVNEINKVDILQVEYFEIVDGNSLQKITNWSDSEYVVGCITVYCGKIRLIDNIRLKG
ncbi:MAG: pantoate--beta-alanine ligase [Paludibacteraceae bacterium]|nr:pantoate--beta-alanine ligase [Paludibacteraceae bacterium]